ncbi:Acyl transferase domain protein [compost metagenome]
MFLADTVDSLVGALNAFAENARPSLPMECGTTVNATTGPAFVFTGNGSQWEGMGRRLLALATETPK